MSFPNKYEVVHSAGVEICESDSLEAALAIAHLPSKDLENAIGGDLVLIAEPLAGTPLAHGGGILRRWSW